MCTLVSVLQSGGAGVWRQLLTSNVLLALPIMPNQGTSWLWASSDRTSALTYMFSTAVLTRNSWLRLVASVESVSLSVVPGHASLVLTHHSRKFSLVVRDAQQGF